MELSVIIPVYNAEKFLSRCLDSIIRAVQRAPAEIILVDDNSTDASPQIIKQYVSKYPQLVSVLKCPIQSGGAARNHGAARAKGKYLWFIDADDTITADSVALLLAKSEQNNADLVMMGAKRCMLDGSASYLSAVKITDPAYKSRFVRYGMGPWQVLIRRSWWQKHNFQFREDIIHEDMELMSALILYTDNFASVDRPLYHYYETPGSILHQAQFSPKVFDIFPALEGLVRRFEKAHAFEQYSAELEWFFIWNLLIDSAKDFARFREAHSGFARSREMLKQYFPHWRRNPFLRQKSLKLRLLVWLNYHK